MEADGARGSWWGPHVRGHVLLFDRRPAAAAGSRLLLAAFVLEVVRLAGVRWLVPAVPLWIFLPAMLALALLSIPRITGLALSSLGFVRWREWTTTERSYFLQVLVIANVVFPIVLRGARPATGSFLSVFVPYLFFGFYQELVYRGLVQRDLVRRSGAMAGVLVANALYTFGPLHWSYFASASSFAVPMFAGIFAIGLVFGAIYHRSGNLWLPAIFHALGNAYIAWRA